MSQEIRKLWHQQSQQQGLLKVGQTYAVEYGPHNSVIYLGKNGSGARFATDPDTLNSILRCVWVSDGKNKAPFMSINEPNLKPDCIKLRAVEIDAAENALYSVKSGSQTLECTRIGIDMQSGLENFSILERVGNLKRSGKLGDMDQNQLTELVASIGDGDPKWISGYDMMDKYAK